MILNWFRALKKWYNLEKHSVKARGWGGLPLAERSAKSTIFLDVAPINLLYTYIQLDRQT